MATMIDAERSAFETHAAWLRNLVAEGALILARPCLGKVNTGITISGHPMRRRHGAASGVSR